MKDYIPIEKDGNRELPIPTLWKEKIGEIVAILPELSDIGSSKIEFLDDVSEDVILSIDRTMADYGCQIDPVSSVTWNTSIYRWMDGYWDVLIDLFSEGELTDLVLFLRVTELDGGYRFRIESVHVP